MFKEYPEVLDDWDPVYQDRINQIVFIGKDLDKNSIIGQLNDCLVD
ncbi:MAG: GTP-binding protein [Acholeplasmatales bacterium]|nr:GTP-binding protein [Acholeplasmatales bacterium]